MDIIKHEPQPAPVQAIAPMSYADMEKLASAIAASNLFGIKTKESALVLMALAAAEGRHPVEAARDYDIIQGRPAKTSSAMLRDFLRAGGTVTWHRLDDTVADATFAHPSGGKVRIHWDRERAAQAGLGGKDMWKKFPRQMLRSRCLSEGIRTVFPGATSGMYVPEEVRDIPPSTTYIEPAPERDITPPPEPPESAAAAALIEAASQGTAALKAAWEALSAPERKAFKADLSELKARAKAADEAREEPAPEEER